MSRVHILPGKITHRSFKESFKIFFSEIFESKVIAVNFKLEKKKKILVTYMHYLRLLDINFSSLNNLIFK